MKQSPTRHVDTSGTMSMAQINLAKSQPSYLRQLAAGHDELGNDMTAHDLRAAAGSIEALLAQLGLRPFAS